MYIVIVKRMERLVAERLTSGSMLSLGGGAERCGRHSSVWHWWNERGLYGTGYEDSLQAHV
jgi:hypothetical protein